MPKAANVIIHWPGREMTSSRPVLRWSQTKHSVSVSWIGPSLGGSDGLKVSRCEVDDGGRVEECESIDRLMYRFFVGGSPEIPQTVKEIPIELFASVVPCGCKRECKSKAKATWTKVTPEWWPRLTKLAHKDAPALIQLDWDAFTVDDDDDEVDEGAFQDDLGGFAGLGGGGWDNQDEYDEEEEDEEEEDEDEDDEEEEDEDEDDVQEDVEEVVEDGEHCKDG